MHRGIAFVADCYAFGLIPPPLYSQALDGILLAVRTPILFFLVVIPYLARGLTHSAPKLPVTQIDKVIGVWDMIRSGMHIDREEERKLEYVAYVERALAALRGDALRDDKETCGLPFREVVGEDDEAQSQLCDFFIWATRTHDEREEQKALYSRFQRMRL